MKVLDPETGEQVSRREFSRRRIARAAERTAPAAAAEPSVNETRVSDNVRRAEWDPQLRRNLTRAQEPRRALPLCDPPSATDATRIVRPSGKNEDEGPGLDELKMTMAQRVREHALGHLVFNDHGDRGPGSYYSLTEQRGNPWVRPQAFK